MIDIVKEYSLWGSFFLGCFLIFMYHFKITLVRYKTYPEIKGRHYTKEEIDEKLEKVELKLESHITEKELDAFEKFIDLRFDQQEKILNKLSSDVTSLTGMINSLRPSEA